MVLWKRCIKNSELLQYRKDLLGYENKVLISAIYIQSNMENMKDFFCTCNKVTLRPTEVHLPPCYLLTSPAHTACMWQRPENWYCMGFKCLDIVQWVENVMIVFYTVSFQTKQMNGHWMQMHNLANKKHQQEWYQSYYYEKCCVDLVSCQTYFSYSSDPLPTQVKKVLFSFIQPKLSPLSNSLWFLF